MRTDRIEGSLRLALTGLLVPVVLLHSGCGGGGGGSSGISTTDFTSWTAVQGSSRVRVPGMSQNGSGTYTLVNTDGIQINTINAPSAVDEASSRLELTFDGNRVLRTVTLESPSGTLSWTDGTSGATVACGSGVCFAESASSSAAFLDPYALGWSYQTFGVWATSGAASGPFTVGTMTAGAPTAGVALPVSGTAIYVGGALGYYVPPSGELHAFGADLTATTDFSARSIAFSTSNTELVSTITGSATSDNGHNLSGTLTYSAGANNFGGPVTSQNSLLSGTATGRFYGPAAQEIGGIFALQGAGLHSMMGSFGGTR